MRVRIFCKCVPGSDIMFNPEIWPRGTQIPTDIPDREVAEMKVSKKDGRYGFHPKMLMGSLIAAGAYMKAGGGKRGNMTSGRGTQVTSIIRRVEEPFIYFLEHSDLIVDVDYTYNDKRERLRTVRARFENWSFMATLSVSDESRPEVVLSLCQLAGGKVGIGSYRIDRGGSCGAFEVVKFQVLEGEEATDKKVEIEYVKSFSGSHKVLTAIGR